MLGLIKNASARPAGESERPLERVDPQVTSTFAIGKLDGHGRQIAEVYGTTTDFVVYRTEDNRIRVVIVDDHLPEADRVHLKRFDEIAEELGRIHALQPEHLGYSQRSILNEVARAEIQCLQNNIARAKAMLADAERRMRKVRTLEGRLHYQVAAGIATLAVVATLFGSKLMPEQVLMLCKILACGSVGGFLSVSIGIRKLEIDPYADWRINAAAGAARIFIALLASVFVYFAMEAQLLLAGLDRPFGFYVAAIVAGFSETLVPNVIHKIDASANSDNDTLAARPAKNVSGTGTPSGAMSAPGGSSSAQGAQVQDTTPPTKLA